MANIFNLIDEYQVLMNDIQSLDGELTEDIIEKLQINEDQVEGKIKAYYNVIKNKEADEVVYKEEIERLSSRIKTNTNLVKRLKQTVSVAVDIFGSILPKAKQKSLVFDTLKVSNKETDSVQINDNFTEVIREKEEYEIYYNYKVELVLNPKQYKILLQVLEQETIVSPCENDETVNDCIKEFIPLSIKANIVPKKDVIKEFYEDRELIIENSKTDLSIIVPDSIPGTYINHNLTPIFK